MNKIDEYIAKIYKDFDEDDEETKTLKEEMRLHLYDEINDLMKNGYTEEQSIAIAISNFGEEENVSDEMTSIIVKQTKYTSVLLKLSIIIFFIGFLSKVGGWYSERQYIDKWQKNRAVTASDIMNELKNILNERTELQENDRKNFDEILNNYNDKYNNGLYGIRILKNNVVYYEYSRNISADLIINAGSGMTVSNNGWEIETHQTDNDQYRDALVWQEMFNIKNFSNTVHFQLNNLGFWLISLSWVLIVMYYTQKAILSDKLNKSKIILLSLQTIIIFATFTSDKDIIMPTVAIFILCNAFYPKVLDKLHRRKELLI